MLIQDRDFACIERHCYGIGTTDQLFRQLQRAINNAAGLVRVPGWKSIPMDGKIASETLHGLWEVGQRVRGPVLDAFFQAPTFEIIAQLAPELIAELSQVQAVAPIKLPPPREPAQATLPSPAPTPPPSAATATAHAQPIATHRETSVAAIPMNVPSPAPSQAPVLYGAEPAPMPQALAAPKPARFTKPAYMMQGNAFSKVPWIIGGVAALGAATAIIVAVTTPAATPSPFEGENDGGEGDDGNANDDSGDDGADDRYEMPQVKGVLAERSASEAHDGLPASP